MKNRIYSIGAFVTGVVAVAIIWTYMGLLYPPAGPDLSMVAQINNATTPTTYVYKPVRLSSTTAIGPTPVFNFTGTGLNQFAFSWSTTGTVSAGACRFEQSPTGTGSWTELIAAETVTSSGPPTSFSTAAGVNYGRFNCTTPISGTGTVSFTLIGLIIASGGSVSFSGELPAGNEIIGSVMILDSAGDDILASTDDCSGTDLTEERYVSAGATEDENEYSATAATLCGVEIANAHATAGAWLKCTNLTAVNTTPGMSTIHWDFFAAAGQTSGNNNIRRTFDTAITCYIVLGKTAAAVDEVAADDVHVTLYYIN